MTCAESAVLWTPRCNLRRNRQHGRTGYVIAARCTLRGQSRHAGRSRPRKRAEIAAISTRVDRGTIPELTQGVRGDGLAMLTNAATDQRSRQHAAAAARRRRRRWSSSTAAPKILELLETVLDAGHYDVVFVESSEHAYSQIKRVQPNLVILCVRIDDMRRLPGAVDAEARRRDARDSGADLHDRVRGAGDRGRGARDVRTPRCSRAKPALRMN